MLAYTYISPGKFELIDKPKPYCKIHVRFNKRREKVSAFSLFYCLLSECCHKLRLSLLSKGGESLS